MSDLRNAAQQALLALLESVDLVQNDYDTDWQHRSPSRAAQMNGKRKMLEAHTDAITALRAALGNEFNPDWDQVEALQESLREHMAEIQRLRVALPEQVPLEPDIAKIVNDNLWNLYVEDQAEPVQSFEDQQRAVNAGDHRRADAVEDPVAWRTFDGEGSYDYRSYEDNEDYIYQYIKRNGGKYANWVEPLYTTPPQRKPLTDEQCVRIFREAFLASSDPLVKDNMTVAFARAIEAAHGIGGEG